MVEEVIARAVLLRGVWFALAAGAVTALVGCGSTSPSVVDPHSPEASHIAGLFWLMLWLSVGIYVLVLGFVLVSFRAAASEDVRFLTLDHFESV